MSRAVYTYTELNTLVSTDNFSKLRHYPIITVSTDIRKSLYGNRSVDRVQGLVSSDASFRTTDFQTFSRVIIKGWNSDRSKFSETAIVSEFLNNKLKAVQPGSNEYNWLRGYIRNIDSIISSFILLELAGMKPEDFDEEDNKNIVLFLEIWKTLLEKDFYVNEFHSRMEQFTDKESWNDIFKDLLKTNSARTVDKIVFMGFYYITPFQERVMRLLEKCGFELVFLINYDSRFPYVYKIWDETYSEQMGFAPRSSWFVEESSEYDPYGLIFEGKEASVSNKLTIREYSSSIEFMDDVRKDKRNGIAVYSSDFKRTNNILKMYFPEDYGDRKLLSYPVGHFVNVLTSLWDEELETIVIDEEKLVDGFLSGWLSAEGKSAKQYVKDLMYILPFFKNCRSLEQWKSRLDYLEKIYSDVLECFRKGTDSDIAIARWQQAVENPLGNFSMFALESERFTTICILLRSLFAMAEEIYDKNKEVTVSEYIERLLKILKRNTPSDDIYIEERQIIEDIFNSLSDKNVSTLNRPSDISKALDYYITGRFDNDELETTRVGLVYPLYFVDAACVKNNSKVHICMCDVERLPGSDKKYTFPLTSTTIERVYAKTGNTLLLNMMEIMKATIMCNRYFIYCALKNNEVILSWISIVNDKKLAPSPYIKLLSNKLDIAIRASKRNRIRYNDVAEANTFVERVSDYDNNKAPMNIVKEARIDYALCPMKYILGYALDKHPSFQNEFQQRYSLNAFISAAGELMNDCGVDNNTVYKNIAELFPQLMKSEKRQVLDYIYYDDYDESIDYKSRTECGTYFYSDERLKLHYPNSEVRMKAMEKYTQLNTPDGRRGINLYENTDVRNACVFCQHIEYCRNAIHAVDQEIYYD